MDLKAYYPECFWCQVADADRLRTICWQWLGIDHEVMVCSDACETALRQFASRSVVEEKRPPPTDLRYDFLAPIPEFWELGLDQDEATIRTIARRHGLLLHIDDVGITLYRADGEELMLTMRDGKCCGIQRLGRVL